MIIEAAACHRYSVPFRMPFNTSRGLQQFREGLLIKLTTDDGITGYGEANSLTAFGTASLDALDHHMRELLERARGRPLDEVTGLLEDISIDQGLAPVRAALDTAVLDIRSSAAGLPLSRYLKPDAVRTVPLNSTISDMNPQGAATAASYSVMAGYSAIKMKVGYFEDTSAEVERVAAVRDAIGPGIELRLDVNGAWTMQRAIEMARAVEPYDIGYLEQPLPARDIGAMAELRQQIGIPLAADEAATNRRAVEVLVDMQAVDVIIIKPVVAGGVSAARELVELGRAAGLQVVVTSAIETGVGIAAALHLAATLPEPVPACGLATATLLETDLLVESPVITGGRMYVPGSPGLGVQPMSAIWDS